MADTQANHRPTIVDSEWPEPAYYQTLILGAGLSGIAMAIQLKRKGFGDDFIILDREDGIAGTWHVNTYPGAGADVPAALYSFSFRQKTDWSTFFPKQPELEAYFCTVAAEYDLMDKFHLQTTVQEARFDEATNLWHIYAEDLPSRSKAGVTPAKHHYVCKFFVSAVGGLSEPNSCNIEGHENFKGTIFHSARWDWSVPLQDKHVVVVGNGSSATQFMPRIAKEAKTLTQFVRAQHWTEPQPKNPLAVIPGWQWLVNHVAFFRKLQRFLIFCVMESHFTGMHLNTFGYLFRRHLSHRSTANVKMVAPKEYHHHLIPDINKLPPQHKRRVLDDGYLNCLNKPHVSLEFEKTARIEEDCVITDTGKRVPADVIILATGFVPSRAGYPMHLYGRGGEEVREHWDKYGDGGPIHYRSTFLSGFPNMATMNGTNSATGHTSLIFTTENQVDLAIEVARPLLDGRRPTPASISHSPQPATAAKSTKTNISIKRSTPSFEVSLSAEVREQYWLQATMRRRIFSKGTGSWYIDSQSGRVTAMHPASQVSMMLRCEFPNWQDYIYSDLIPGRTTNDKRYPIDRSWWKVMGNKWFSLGTTPQRTPAQAGLKDYGI